MVWSWKEDEVGNMRNNYDIHKIAPSQKEIKQLRKDMERVNKKVIQWIAEEKKIKSIKS